MNRVALLRGVNLVRSRRISMPELRAIFVKLGFADARTLLQSGNVVFTDRRSNATLERMLELEMERLFKIATSCFVRGTKELQEVIAQNPFARQAKEDPSSLLVVFLKEVRTEKDVQAMRTANKGPELVDAVGKHAYVYYPEGMGRSRFRLGWHGTARNWNTVTKLLALME